MGWEAWLTVGVAALLLLALTLRIAATDLLAISCLAILLVAQNVTGTDRLPDARQAALGFGNEGLITVGLLFAVVAGLELTGGTELATFWLLKRAKTLPGAQMLLLGPVAVLSGFLNNTPVVAAMLPVVNDLSKRVGASSSQLLLPLSYATILGGLCTLIGTSTNLIVQGKWVSKGMPELSFFEPAPVGIPLTICGIAYMILCSRWLLPKRQAAVSAEDDPRKYTVEMVVTPRRCAGRSNHRTSGTASSAGTISWPRSSGAMKRSIKSIQRRSCRPDDLLILVGALESVIDLQKIRGLEPPGDSDAQTGFSGVASQAGRSGGEQSLRGTR